MVDKRPKPYADMIEMKDWSPSLSICRISLSQNE